MTAVVQNEMVVIPPILIVEATLDASNVAEADNPEWLAGTSYIADDEVMIATTVSDIHRNYRALQASIGLNPVDDQPPPLGTGEKLFWLDIGPTNKWAMFDQENSTQTTNALTIEVEATPGEVVGTVAALNLDAESVQVIMTDPVAGEVYNQTRSLISVLGITDFYQWMYAPIEFKTAAVFDDLPPFRNATTKTIISKTSGTVGCGVLAMGREREIGAALHGSSFGIKSFSSVKEDAFGNLSILKRGFSNRPEFEVVLDTERLDSVQNLLNSLTDLPVVWIGNKNIEASFAYGTYDKFRIITQNTTITRATIRILGLTT